MDRFRMLTVNLSKKDRELVHKRIVARDVTPAMLAVMSVHELADAATQRTIKNAEREALDHSTLRIATAAGPRTKSRVRSSRSSAFSTACRKFSGTCRGDQAR